jgi:hydrocephalus-inducing protein
MQQKNKRPFGVSPEHGILPMGENMQVTLTFRALKCGQYCGHMTIEYGTPGDGDRVHVAMFGSAQDVNVRLEKSSLLVDDTYITMSNQRTVRIHNRSDVLVRFEWKRYATVEEEEQQKLKEIVMLNRDEETAKSKLYCAVGQSGAAVTDYAALLARNFHNKIKTTQRKAYLFNDNDNDDHDDRQNNGQNVFSLLPVEGEIWPNSSVDIAVIFKPDVAQVYDRVAYCDVIGRESRLPLRLSGVGCGPKVQLSIESLDVGDVFIGSTHVYEVLK